MKYFRGKILLQVVIVVALDWTSWARTCGGITRAYEADH